MLRMMVRKVRKLLTDLALCARTAWRCRGELNESAGEYAAAAVENTALCAEVRRRNPGRRIFWSHSTNHSGRAVPQYVAVWTVGPQVWQATSATLVFHGTRDALRMEISEGSLDDVVAKAERRQAVRATRGVCPECLQQSVVSKPVEQGGGEVCTTPGCGYWFCF